jgi:UDP-GlcNAc:undecaprenyl-phosphate GlcNAc-1-phosphate transferase
MTMFLLPFCVSGLLASAMTSIHIRLARRAGWLDHPRPSKIHDRPIPTMGGMAVIAAVLASSWLAAGRAGWLQAGHVAALALASAPIIIVGVWDDLHGCRIWPRLAAHFLAGSALYVSGLRVTRLTNPFGDSWELGPLGYVVTIVWVAVLINALNIIDGLDGLASGTGLLAAWSIGCVGLLRHETDTAVFGFVVAGALAGFIPYNFPRARVFLGDVGSTFIGLALAVLSLLENRKTTTSLTLFIPLVALALPVLETSLSILRRARGGLNPMRGDLGHLHHRLLRRGMTPARATSVLLVSTAAAGLSAIVLSMVAKETALLLTGGVGILVLLGLVRALSENRS